MLYSLVWIGVFSLFTTIAIMAKAYWIGAIIAAGFFGEIYLVGRGFAESPEKRKLRREQIPMYGYFQKIWYTPSDASMPTYLASKVLQAHKKLRRK